MAAKTPVREIVARLAEEPVASLGLELVDVELVREGKARILRLIVDKPGGVSLDDCTAVSRLVDPLIDSHAEASGHDYFEVSSPGLERPLKTDRDLARHLGEEVEMKLYQALDGKKTWKGRLAPCSEAEIRLDLDDGTQLAVPRQAVAKIKRIVRF